MSLPKKDQNDRKLNILSNLILSRMMPKIHEFGQNEATKEHDTEFNWHVILGTFTPMHT